MCARACLRVLALILLNWLRMVSSQVHVQCHELLYNKLHKCFSQLLKNDCSMQMVTLSVSNAGKSVTRKWVLIRVANKITSSSG